MKTEPLRKAFLFVRSRFLWILALLVLGFLFIASSTDLLIREQEKEVFRISVILDDTTDETFVNFRKGAEQAAYELRADVSFVTLYERANAAEQEELIFREQEDGAQALIIAPVDEITLSSMVAEQRLHVPVVFIRSDVVIQNMDRAANIHSDYQALGRQTASAIISRWPSSVPVYYLSVGRPYGAAARFLEGTEALFGEAGYRREQLIRAANETGIERIRKLEQEESAVILALDRISLLRAASFRRQKGRESGIDGLYGPGTSVEALSFLEAGDADGLVVTDDFAEGYLAVRTAAEQIGRHNSPMQSRVLEGYFMEREDLEDGRYEQMLYPVE